MLGGSSLPAVLSVGVSSAVGQVPETEAAVGRELDHPLHGHNSRYCPSCLHLLQVESGCVSACARVCVCVCRSGRPCDHGQPHECSSGKQQQQQQLCDGAQLLHRAGGRPTDSLHQHRDTVGCRQGRPAPAEPDPDPDPGVRPPLILTQHQLFPVSSDGRTVAIKKIQAKTFSLSKTIRQEVKQVR